MNNLIFKILLFHQYFDDGIARNIHLQADTETQAFLNRYQIKALQSLGVFALHYFGSNTAQDFIESLTHLLDGRPLRFNMLSSDSHFAVITDLPVDWCGQLQYSSRDVFKQEESIELALQLQARTVTQTAIVGQIAIYPDDLLTAQRKIPQPSFWVRIKARQTHWHYYVVNRSQIKVHNLEVSNPQGFVFDKPQQVTLRNGERALLFSSGEHTFAFSETLKAPFNLVDVMPNVSDQQSQHQSLSVRQLITGLPMPKTDVLTIEMHNGQPYVYSPMYVYL